MEVGHDSIFQKVVWDLTGEEIDVCSGLPSSLGMKQNETASKHQKERKTSMPRGLVLFCDTFASSVRSVVGDSVGTRARRGFTPSAPLVCCEASERHPTPWAKSRDRQHLGGLRGLRRKRTRHAEQGPPPSATCVPYH